MSGLSMFWGCIIVCYSTISSSRRNCLSVLCWQSERNTSRRNWQAVSQTALSSEVGMTRTCKKRYRWRKVIMAEYQTPFTVLNVLGAMRRRFLLGRGSLSRHGFDSHDEVFRTVVQDSKKEITRQKEYIITCAILPLHIRAGAGKAHNNALWTVRWKTIIASWS